MTGRRTLYASGLSAQERERLAEAVHGQTTRMSRIVALYVARCPR